MQTPGGGTELAPFSDLFRFVDFQSDFITLLFFFWPLTASRFSKTCSGHHDDKKPAAARMDSEQIPNYVSTNPKLIPNRQMKC